MVTDNGNLLLDWLFPEANHDWKQLSVQLKMIPGEVSPFNAWRLSNV